MADSAWDPRNQGRDSLESAILGLHQDVESGRIDLAEIGNYSCSSDLKALVTPESVQALADQLICPFKQAPEGDNSTVLLAAIIGDLATTLCQSGLWAEAEPLVNLVEAAYARHRKSWLVDSIVAFADALGQAGLTEIATRKYHQALERIESAPELISQDEYHRQKATILSKAGQFEKATEIAFQSGELKLGIAILVDAVEAEKLSMENSRLWIQEHSAIIAISDDPVFQLADSIAEMLDNSESMDPSLLRYLSLTYHVAQVVVKYVKPDVFDRLFQVLEAGFCRTGEAQTLAHFHLDWAKKLYHHGHFMKSLSWVSRVIDELKNAEDPELLADTMVFKGAILDEIGQYVNAIEAFDQAEKVLLNYPDAELLARCLLNRGGTLIHLEKYDEAMIAFVAAEHIYQEANHTDSALRCQVNRAIALKHLNRWAEAESIFQQTAPELIQFGMHREYATVQQYRVEIAMESGEFHQAIEIYSEMDRSFLSDQSCATLLAMISEAYYQTGQVEQGRLHFRQACDYRAKASQKAGIDVTSLEYIGLRQGFFAKGVRIALEKDDIESAFESVVAAKGSLLGDLQSYRQRPMVPENIVVSKARRELGEWLFERGRSTIPGDDGLHEPETLARMKDYLEAFRSAHPGSSGFDEPVVNRAEIHEIQASLAEGWGILDFWRIDQDKVAVFLLTKSQFQCRRLKVPFETASFRANLIRFGKCIDESMPVASDEILDDLYHYLFEPLLPLLEGLNGLYLVPHERLHYLPLHACRRFINGHYRYLNDDFEIAYLPSARILKHLPPMNLDGSIFSLANPDLGTPKTLPFAHWEHQWMKQAFPNRPIRGFSGPRATQDRLQGWSNASLLHFSCHGAGEHRDVAFSRLHLADDVLLAHDVIHHLEPLKSGSMVVLNGCQTARLDDRSLDESIGLATAFLMRGAGLTLSTSWSVDDCCAAEFVTCFLDHLLKNGLTPTQAIRQAQAHVRGLSSDHLAARENHLLRLFPAIDFPFEAASIHRRAAWRLMRSGNSDEARKHGQLAAEAMRLSGNSVSAQSILDAIGKAMPQNESSAFDHPIYWSAFRLIGRAH